MKRSRMNPGTKGLQRKTRLQSKGDSLQRSRRGLQQTGIQSRGSVGDASPDGSTTPRPNGPVKARKPAKPGEAAAERAARRDTTARSGGVCERCGRRRATEWHHRLNRSQGGLWSTSNGLHLDTDCHRYITEHPAQAYASGWSVRSGHDPMEIPVLRRGARVLLDDEGGMAAVELGGVA